MRRDSGLASGAVLAALGVGAFVWYAGKRASAPLSGVGCPPKLGQFDFETPDIQYDTTAEMPDFQAPQFDPADWGGGEASTIMALPDGTTIDLTDANQFTDPQGLTYIAAWDGSMIYEDGTVIKPDGAIMTPGGTVINPDYSMTLTNGETIPAATLMSDGSGWTSAENIAKLISQGLTVASATLTTLQKFGITPSGHVTAGVPSSTGWVSGTQYKTATGAIVTPSKLSNGLYQLPDGTTIGAPPESGLFGFDSKTLLLGAAAVGAIMLLKR